MATQPNVFISSTYSDLADLREVLADFFSSLKWNATIFERGGVFYDPSKLVDESCCDAVHKSHMFVLIIGGRYGTSAPSSKLAGKSGAYHSITKEEYLAAKERHIPTYVFVKHDVDVEFKSYLNFDPRTRDSHPWVQVDDSRVFKLLNTIYQQHRGNKVFTFATVSDITTDLTEQIAGITEYSLARRRRAPRAKVPINGYKLFFFRMQRGLSFTGLARETGINRERLRRLEWVNTAPTERLGPGLFQKCRMETVDTLETALGCPKKLLAGAGDDFLSMYIHYYHTYKGQAPAKRRQADFDLDPIPTRTVVFDFDGTLTVGKKDLTTWERIWKKLGYNVNKCALYHRRFSTGGITHKEWCQITRDHFRKGGLTEAGLTEIARDIELIDDAKEVLTELHDRGIELFILSGSIRQVIKAVLGDLYDLFSEVQANNLTFDRRGLISNIFGTRYDFEGKADYIKNLIDSSEISPLEVLFVGNSSNDVFASRSGARTLCVNPRFTNPDVLEHWTYCLRTIKSLREIMPLIG